MNNNRRQVVILAGGKGTRLKEVSGDIPKPMVPILGKPLLQHLIEQCAKYDFLDICLLVSYKGDVIEEYFGDGSQYGVSIQYYRENTPRGTAGALLDILDQLNEQFLVLYGDTYFDVDLGKFWEFYKDKSGDAAIFLHPNDHPHDSDLVEIDKDLMITNLHGYPHDELWRRNLVNAAVYILSKTSLSGINVETEKPDIAKDLFPLMISADKKIFGYISVEYLKDMGTPERLKKVEGDIASGKVERLKLSNKKTAIFLDRDGVINHEVNHLSAPKQFKLIAGVGKAIKRVNQAGFLVVVITNQPVVARGDISEDELLEIHNKLDTMLGGDGAYIDRLYYCPHHPDSGFNGEVVELKVVCDCRKPKPGLLLQAAEDMNISLQDSWMVGDSSADMLAGEKAGVQTILVKTGYAGKDGKYNVNPDFIVDDLSEAVDFVLSRG